MKCPMKERTFVLFQGPHDGSKVTTGRDDGVMPVTIWLQRQANKDGFQPWADRCRGKFVVKYVRVFWKGTYRFSGYGSD